MKISYKKNSIVQFLISYILILAIPMLILGYGFQKAFEIVENDIADSHISVLQNSVNIIDGQLEEMQGLALQISQNVKIQDFAGFQKEDNGYIVPALRVIDEYYNMMHYQSIELMGESYLYFQGKDLILYQSTLYRPEVFEKYLVSWETSLEAWRNDIVNPSGRIPRFQKNGHTIEYVMPFSQSLTGDNQGVLVFRIKPEKLQQILDFSQIYNAGDYMIEIRDTDDVLIWSYRNLESSTLDESVAVKEYVEQDGISIIEVKSPKYGWNYVLAVPEKHALMKLSDLKNFVFLLIGITLFSGIMISLYLAFRKGKPINETLQVMASFGKGLESYSDLGEVVTGILKDHQDLLSEMEQDKESVKKAFLHDLIKAEFVNEQQLIAGAKREGLLISGNHYLILAFEFFQNDDYSEIDEQTLNEVRIIAQMIQKQLLLRYRDKVWFYKWNYRDTIAILSTEKSPGEEQIQIEEIRRQILEEYHVETNWGISSVCDNLVYLWKAAGEARQALKHASEKNCIIIYSVELENEEEPYLPEIASEKLLSCMQNGNLVEIDEILRFLKTENFVKRKWKRTLLIRFNRKVMDLLSKFMTDNKLANDQVIWLNEAVIHSEENVEEYFNRLGKICRQIGISTAERKNLQRKKMIENIMIYMHENYMDSGMGLAKVGSVFRISEGYLSSIFKEQTGGNFADYLEKIRIDKACELLRDEKITISEIADQVGYNSVQSFRRAFKRVKEVSPKEARK